MHNDDNKDRVKANRVKGSDTDLTLLWQNQPVNDIDLSEVKKSFNSERIKQRIYMVIDSLALLPSLYFLSIYWGELSFTAKGLCIFMVATAIPFLIYQLWLRRVAAFAKDSQTLDHLHQYTRQIKNNIRIAFITKHSAWPALFVLPAFALERYFFGELSPEKWEKIAFSFPIATLILVVWGIWAHKRQQRFEKQLKALEEMAEQRTV